MNIEETLEEIDAAYAELAKKRRKLIESGATQEALLEERIACDNVDRIKQKLLAQETYAKFQWGNMCEQYETSNARFGEVANVGLVKALREISESLKST